MLIYANVRLQTCCRCSSCHLAEALVNGRKSCHRLKVLSLVESLVIGCYYGVRSACFLLPLHSIRNLPICPIHSICKLPYPVHLQFALCIASGICLFIPSAIPASPVHLLACRLPACLLLPAIHMGKAKVHIGRGFQRTRSHLHSDLHSLSHHIQVTRRRAMTTCLSTG